MKQILILTKNILADQAFQNELQQLNYEVLCSSQLLDRLHTMFDYTKNEISHYSSIMLSETISDVELKQFLNKLSSDLATKNISIIRLGVRELSEEVKKEWKLEGIDEWLYHGMDKYELREKLAELVLEKQEQFFKPLEQKEQFSYKLPHLSKLEKSILEELTNSTDMVVSRDELCRNIWNQETTDSRLSHLSSLVKNLRDKFSLVGFGEECIMTIWGEGYKLNDDLYEWYLGARAS
ncbi:helix-turn-helix domain-containing protein [Enterococcus gilvus]|uniref:winged helix-turn-helix domain-containing protein n=1 Tax=Enterococcus gilvus TaxID=160453 RepID=UPI001C8C774E|nr:helix-turn-helix domain-containing protein [Enterococcus gilvus]MBX8937041.1 hypothetical protein [Enterococcus gilvus]